MTRPASSVSSPAIARSSVDLPLPLGPSRAVSEPFGHLYRYVVEGLKVTEALARSLDCDSHQASSFLFEDVHCEQGGAGRAAASSSEAPKAPA